jgi:competence protein ComEA
VRLTSRSSDDDADIVRARLRALLDDGRSASGWVPDDDPGRPVAEPAPEATTLTAEGRDWRAHPVTDTEPDPETEPPDGELPPGIGRHRSPGPAVRLDPGRRGARALWVAGLLGALLVLAWTWLERPQVHPVPQPARSTATASTVPRTPPVGEAARTAATVVVSVVGQVAKPGLVTLPTGARVADAIQAAGGLVPGVDAGAVNQAAVVSDGQQIAVGIPAAASAATTRAGSSATTSAERVDLNTATVSDLDGLPGVGPVLAQRIIDFREQRGRFTTVDQLNDVPGIGPSLYARLAPLVRA